MNRYLKSKLAFDKKLKKRNDVILKIFIAIFICGYLFFFTSNLFFPKVYKFDEINYVGQTIDAEDCVLTLDSFDYSKKERSFEIIFEVETLTVGEEDWDIICRHGDKMYDAEVYCKPEGLLVVRVYGVDRRWTEVILTVTYGTKSANLHMNDKEVHEVSEIQERTDHEYKVYALEQKIEGMKESIKRIETEVAERNKKINAAYEKMDQLESKKKYQTEQQQQETENRKSKIANEYEKLLAEQDEAMLAINELKASIKIQSELYNEILKV